MPAKSTKPTRATGAGPRRVKPTQPATMDAPIHLSAPTNGNVQLIATSGGLKEVADGSEVMVFRTATGAREAARFDVDEIKAGRAPDPPVMQGDVVIVGTSAAKKLYNDIMKALPMVGMFATLL